MGKTTIEMIPLDAVVSVEVNGGFYARLHQLKATMLAGVSVEDMPKIVEELKKGGTSHPIAYHVETILVLMKEIEDKARENKLTKQPEVDLPEPDQN